MAERGPNESSPESRRSMSKTYAVCFRIPVTGGYEGYSLNRFLYLVLVLNLHREFWQGNDVCPTSVNWKTLSILNA